MKTISKILRNAILCFVIIFITLTLFGFMSYIENSTTIKSNTYNVDIQTYNVNGHEYILAVTYNTFMASPKLVLSSTLIHSESCSCKNRKKD